MHAPRAWLALAAGAVALCFAGSCHDSGSLADAIDAPVQVLGAWSFTVTQTGNTCAGEVEPTVSPTLLLTPDGERYMARVDGYDDSGWCWVFPFDGVDETVLHTEYGGLTASHACNDGCRSLTFSTVDVTFSRGGTFEAVERVTFTPMSAECDVAACGYPCEEDSFHVVWGFGLPRCGFGCEVTYRWSGIWIGDELPGDEQCRTPAG